MFQISVKENSDVAFSGSLTAYYVDRIREELEGRSESYRIDLSELRYISSAGLGLLVGLQKKMQESRQEIVLIHANDHVRELFRITGLDGIFSMNG